MTSPTTFPSEAGGSGVNAPILFEIPQGAPPARCRGCLQPIYWIITKAGKRMPVDPDGTSHFATCPKAASFRRNP